MKQNWSPRQNVYVHIQGRHQLSWSANFDQVKVCASTVFTHLEFSKYILCTLSLSSATIDWKVKRNFQLLNIF